MESNVITDGDHKRKRTEEEHRVGIYSDCHVDDIAAIRYLVQEGYEISYIKAWYTSKTKASLVHADLEYESPQSRDAADFEALNKLIIPDVEITGSRPTIVLVLCPVDYSRIDLEGVQKLYIVAMCGYNTMQSTFWKDTFASTQACMQYLKKKCELTGTELVVTNSITSELEASITDWTKTNLTKLDARVLGTAQDKLYDWYIDVFYPVSADFFQTVLAVSLKTLGRKAIDKSIMTRGVMKAYQGDVLEASKRLSSYPVLTKNSALEPESWETYLGNHPSKLTTEYPDFVANPSIEFTDLVSVMLLFNKDLRTDKAYKFNGRFPTAIVGDHEKQQLLATYGSMACLSNSSLMVEKLKTFFQSWYDESTNTDA